MYKKEKNLLTAGAITAGLLIVVYYFHGANLTDPLSVASLLSPLTIVSFFIDPLTIVLTLALIVCISFHRHFEEKEQAAWRKAHIRNDETQEKHPSFTPPKKPVPDIAIESDEYEKLFAGGEIEIRLPRSNNETYTAGQTLRLRLADDFGQFKNVTIIEVRTQDTANATVVVRIAQ